MRLTSAIAIYFIIWWAVLFVVLPWGIRNPHEAGEEIEAGHEPGAPVNPRLGRKAMITTVVTTIVFALVYGIITQGWITLNDLPF
jgi:predicted secreted protein